MNSPFGFSVRLGDLVPPRLERVTALIPLTRRVRAKTGMASKNFAYDPRRQIGEREFDRVHTTQEHQNAIYFGRAFCPGGCEKLASVDAKLWLLRELSAEKPDDA